MSLNLSIHTKNILDEMCKKKERMKELPDEELSSWKRALLILNGTWQTRGHLTKNVFFCNKELHNRWSFMVCPEAYAREGQLYFFFSFVKEHGNSCS